MRILVVEDDQISMRLVKTHLTKQGHEVLAAETGTQALDLLRNDDLPDMVISDVMMPVLDGFKLLERIRSDQRLARLPVLLCTALNDVQSVRRSLGLGATDYLTKPIDKDSLLSKIEKIENSLPGAVLVVDDEELLRHLLENILNRDGIRVVQASNGREALGKLEDHRISVILSDIVMPEMDGLEMLTEVRKKYPKMPVFMITGRPAAYHREEILKAGASGYIAKPFRNTDILDRLRPYVYHQ